MKFLVKHNSYIQELFQLKPYERVLPNSGAGGILLVNLRNFRTFSFITTRIKSYY